MGSCQISKNLINLDLIKIIQFYLKIYDLWTHPHLWAHVWVVVWMGVLMVEISKKLINLHLFEIIQFCLNEVM